MRGISTIVLGDDGVGKTSIISQFTTAMAPSKRKSTNLSLTRLTVDGEDFALGIVDTSSSSSRQLDEHCATADAYIVVYSITSRRSFLSVPLYLQHIARVHPSYSPLPIIIVGNKSDEINAREVSYEDGEMLARSRGCVFTESSAVDHTNINHLFDVIVREWLNSQAPTEVDTCTVN